MSCSICGSAVVPDEGGLSSELSSVATLHVSCILKSNCGSAFNEEYLINYTACIKHLKRSTVVSSGVVG